MKVLLVDDHKGMRDFFGLEITNLGHEVVKAVDGNDATRKHFDAAGRVDTSFDAVVTDLQMPHMNGMELIAYLRLHNVKTPCLIHTAGSFGGDGGYEFVTFGSKNDPNHIEEFLRTVEAKKHEVAH